MSVQAGRLGHLWSAVVLATIDDAIRDNRQTGQGTDSIRRWATSRDGHDVLRNAGIDPGERATAGLVAFVERGVPTSVVTMPGQTEPPRRVA